jgi:hypothetical protein
MADAPALGAGAARAACRFDPDLAYNLPGKGRPPDAPRPAAMVIKGSDLSQEGRVDDRDRVARSLNGPSNARTMSPARAG